MLLFKDILENDQYPASFYEHFISSTIEKLLLPKPNDPETDNDEGKSCFFFNIEGLSRMTLYECYVSPGAPVQSL